MGVACVIMSVACVTMSVACVTVGVACVTMGVACVTMSVACVTHRIKYNRKQMSVCVPPTNKDCFEELGFGGRRQYKASVNCM
jgi:hypothetical protein